jgi:uncharacterized membrane protein
VQGTVRNPIWKQTGRMLDGLFALVMVVFGIEHFIYANYTPGIPSCSFVSFWIPGRLFWGYMSGAALLVGGTMMLTRKRPRAAAARGVMITVVAVLTYDQDFFGSGARVASS